MSTTSSLMLPTMARFAPVFGFSKLGHSVPGVSINASPLSSDISCFPLVTPALFPAFAFFKFAKLFMNVREKESLAYYASSSYASHHGLVFVTSGIEAVNEEKAYALIQQQLTAMATGDISEREMTQTKAMLQNQLREALDSARGQIEVYDQYKELNEIFTIEAWSKKWQDVTKEDIMRMAKQVKLEAAYFLSGKEEA